ncbi:hypothetical protein [Pseudomonas savastanoi]|uniref:hypothetical protein n=1 Tax=Pseudomonas savastanoi TaxID=29438 RepID=UPI00198127A8|nr:hypothetical protein [Pseudomonas savastanoi]
MGDPDRSGTFGIHGCMGSVRDWEFDAVIGIGGIGSEPQSHGIAGRVTWAGRKPKKRHSLSGVGMLVTFEAFTLLDSKGPLLSEIAPNLARRMYEGRVRTLLDSYSIDEQAEAEHVIKLLLGSTQVPHEEPEVTGKTDVADGTAICPHIRCTSSRRLGEKNC